MEKEIKRGDVWWISVDDSVGSEMQTGRPAVVVSGDGMNSQVNTVIVAYATTTVGESHPCHVRVTIDGKEGQVLCNHVRTIDKRRCSRYICGLTDPIMKKITGALAVSQCIPTPVEKKSTVEDNKELLSLRVELDVIKRMYTKVVNQLAEMRIEADVNKKSEVESVAAVSPKVEEKDEVSSEPELVEINACTRADLVKLGLNTVLINNIFRHRPYRTVSDLWSVPGVTKDLFDVIKTKVVCTPIVNKKQNVVETKVNVNTATAKDLVEKLGLSLTTAKQIVSCRNKFGKFDKLEDLLVVPRFGNMCLKKYGSKIEV